MYSCVADGGDDGRVGYVSIDDVVIFFFALHYFMSIYWRLSFASSGSAALLTWSAIAALSVVHPLCCLRIRVHV